MKCFWTGSHIFCGGHPSTPYNYIADLFLCWVNIKRISWRGWGLSVALIVNDGSISQPCPHSLTCRLSNSVRARLCHWWEVSSKIIKKKILKVQFALSNKSGESDMKRFAEESTFLPTLSWGVYFLDHVFFLLFLLERLFLKISFSTQ